NAPIGDCLGPPTRTFDASISKNFRLTERVKVQFRMDAFNLFNHPQYGNPGSSIGFNAPNTCPVLPGTTPQPEFLDATGKGVCSAATAVSIQNTSPNPKVGIVSTLGDRSREFQYSVRFTF